jgi:hypothetical protein
LIQDSPAKDRQETTVTPLCDQAGHTVGFFLTVAEHERLQRLEEEHRRLLYAWGNAQFTDEELDRAELETEEESLADLWRRLGQS